MATVVGTAGCTGGGDESVDLIIVTQGPDGDPIPGASVTIDGETLESDQNAQARFEGMSPGVYEYTVEQSDFTTEEGEVEVPEGGHEQWYHEVNLEPA